MTQPHRNHAFDNLRTLMVLFIVLLHAACAYANGIPWWHAQDAKHDIFDLLIVIIDTFALPVLFFIAGLFALPTYERCGAVGFIRNKLRRLGIPLLLITAFNLPTMVYVGYIHRTPAPVGFFKYWLNWMASFTDWSGCLITSMEIGARYADATSPHHLWFISLLLIFFLGYAVFRSFFVLNIEAGMPRLIGLVAVFIFAGFTATNLLMQDWAWARFGPFILFQPTRIAVYLGMFLFGTLARPHMDKLRPFPGPWWAWMTAFLVSVAVLVVMIRALMAPGPAPLHLAIIHGALRAALAITAAGFFINLGTYRLGAPSDWRESLSASSYDIYLWHMPLAVFVQALLVTIAIPLGAKMMAAFLAPVLLFWLMSRASARFGPWIWTGYAGITFLAFIAGAG